MKGQALRNCGEFSGRLLLGLLFVLEACSKVGAYNGAASYMAAFGMPSQLLPAAIAFELIAGVLVIVGWHMRMAALGLAVFCVVVSVIFHTGFSDRNQVLHFEKDLALGGAFLVIWARGAAACSLDTLLARSRRGGAASELASPARPAVDQHAEFRR